MEHVSSNHDGRQDKPKLGVLLLKEGKINTMQFEMALLYQKLLSNRGKRVKIGQFLVKHGCISSTSLCETLIKQTHRPSGSYHHDPAVFPV